MDSLAKIADKEIAGISACAMGTAVSQQIVFEGGCGWKYDGWYVFLFMIFLPKMNGTRKTSSSRTFHTDPNSGTVMHAGTGHLNLGIVIAPSQNGGSTAYVGPMMSYYEYKSANYKRLTDGEWPPLVDGGQAARPDFVSIYLADKYGKKRAPRTRACSFKQHRTHGGRRAQWRGIEFRRSHAVCRCAWRFVDLSGGDNAARGNSRRRRQSALSRFGSHSIMKKHTGRIPRYPSS